MIRYAPTVPLELGPPGLMREISLKPVWGLKAISTFVKGSQDTYRRPGSGTPAGFGVQPLQLPLDNESEVTVWSKVRMKPICELLAAFGSAKANVRVMGLMAPPVALEVVLKV